MNIVRRRGATVAGFLRGRAFTLIELMVAIAIGALLMMTAIPFARKAQKTPLVRATLDLEEALRQARIKAILTGKAMQVVIYDNGGALGVEPVPNLTPEQGFEAATEAQAEAGAAEASVADAGSKPVFQARLHEEVAFRQLLVNGRNMMQEQATAVRFFPNGTSDALDAELQWLRREARRITLDVMTGLPRVEDVK
jgi:prepilin-type N-terminal cleavage/methylation domain-containing protein